VSVRLARVRCRGRELEVSGGADGAWETGAGERPVPGEFIWLPPATGTVIGVALNLASEVGSMQEQFLADPYKAPPKWPVLFIKPRGTLCGHLSPVQQPRHTRAIQPGAALAVVIGTRTFRAAAADAWNSVAGYTLFNDFSLPEESFFRPPIKSKCLDSFGPMGPCIVPRDEIPDPRALTVRTFVNGWIRQQIAMRDLIHDFPALIEHITGFMTLSPGDVLVPAVPVARLDVIAGDTVAVEVEGIGRLENRVVHEQDYYAGIEDVAA